MHWLKVLSSNFLNRKFSKNLILNLWYVVEYFKNSNEIELSYKSASRLLYFK